MFFVLIFLLAEHCNFVALGILFLFSLDPFGLCFVDIGFGISQNCLYFFKDSGFLIINPW